MSPAAHELVPAQPTSCVAAAAPDSGPQPDMGAAAAAANEHSSCQLSLARTSNLA